MSFLRSSAMVQVVEATDEEWRRLADYVRVHRALLDRTQKQLAAGFLSPTTYQKVENAKGPVSAEILEAIDRAFDWDESTCYEVLKVGHDRIRAGLSDELHAVAARHRAISGELERIDRRLRRSLIEE